jgi:hypothetical protein
MNADPHGLREDGDDHVEDGVAVVTAQASAGDTAARSIK